MKFHIVSPRWLAGERKLVLHLWLQQDLHAALLEPMRFQKPVGEFH